MMLWFVLSILLIVIFYWELVIAEGAHLGPRVVTWLYDLIAWRYDRIKKFDLAVEADLLGLPLTEALIFVDAPLILDVGAGTGRVARALLRQPAFDGSIVNLELSRRMLHEGQRACAPWPTRTQWLCGPAHQLPFAADTFDAVACVEALEFLPDARAALAECVRVLRPGGLLIVTNRVGWQARLIFGKTFPRAGFQQLLSEFSLEPVRVHPWQVEYDLGWAVKRMKDEG
jgi:ubiquinone/menaquinone biosynthesis C-methylase UbiE